MSTRNNRHSVLESTDCHCTFNESSTTSVIKNRLRSRLANYREFVKVYDHHISFPYVVHNKCTIVRMVGFEPTEYRIQIPGSYHLTTSECNRRYGRSRTFSTNVILLICEFATSTTFRVRTNNVLVLSLLRAIGPPRSVIPLNEIVLTGIEPVFQD